MDVTKAFQIATCIASEPLPPKPVSPCSASEVAECTQPVAAPNIAQAISIVRSVAEGCPTPEGSLPVQNIVSALCVVVSRYVGSSEAESVSSTQPSALPGSERGTKSLDEYLAEVERREVLLALEASGRNATEAARLLGISYRSMRYRLTNLGIE